MSGDVPDVLRSGATDHVGMSTAHVLSPDSLADHIDHLYRMAWALCGSQHDAEDLVQDTLVAILARPRILRHDNERGYLLRALRNTFADRYRSRARQPVTYELLDDDDAVLDDDGPSAREIMQAIASAPPRFRDAVVAVDVLGLSYREAARSLKAPEATIATRVHRGRQHIAGQLLEEVGAGERLTS
jgi:RNA polymerase sigma-70 factor (ECF subfamily)